jgi:xanthine dehydrogenase accessory factor
VYDIALSVSACLRAGTHVDVAWVVATDGLRAREPNEAVALTPGGGRIGTVLSGAADNQLAELAGRAGAGRAVRLAIGDFEAELAGLPHGGEAVCVLVPAAELPAALWDRLRERRPVCLVARIEENRITEIQMYDKDSIGEAGEEAAGLFSRGTSDSVVSPDAVTTLFWPVPALLIIGAGPIAQALRANAELLGWQARVVTETAAATGQIAALAALDSVVVVGHDHDLVGPALMAALAGEVGYIGAVGPRHLQEARADWLAYRGVTDLRRIHRPAGLDIGARTPAEIAVAVLAEALAGRPRAEAGSRPDTSVATP